MTAPPTSPVTARGARATLAVPVSAVLGSGLSYGLLLVAARVLTHGSYGSFVALTTIMAVGSIPSLAMQAVAARRVASGAGTAGVVAVSWAIALAWSAVLAAVAIPLDAFVHIHSVGATLWLAVSLIPLTVSGPLVGAAQGAERLVAFSGMSLLQAVGRFGGSLAPIALGYGQSAAMGGAAVGTTAAVLACAALLGRNNLHLSADRSLAAARSVLVESAHALHGYAAILVLTSLDLLLARHTISSEQAAQYAAGSVVSKVAVWLPQSISLVVYASMAADADHRRVVRRSAAIVLGLGAVTIAGCALFGGLMSFVVGGHFAVLSSSGWIFAVLGTALAVLQFTVVAGLATRTTRRLAVLWLAMAAEAVVVPLMGPSADASQVAAAVAAVVTVAAVVALWLAAELPLPGLRRRRMSTIMSR